MFRVQTKNQNGYQIALILLENQGLHIPDTFDKNRWLDVGDKWNGEIRGDAISFDKLATPKERKNSPNPIMIFIGNCYGLKHVSTMGNYLDVVFNEILFS
jgi:hypothetical protein